MLKYVSTLFIVLGIIFIAFFGYQLFQSKQSQKDSLANAEELISSYKGKESNEEGQTFQVATNEAFATLEIPKLNKTLPIVEGTDADALDKGIGHLVDSVFPGEGEQIVLSGHRDTVFRNFAQIEIGDQFTVNMPYGSYTYEIRETEIVSEDDTSVIRNMGEEVLVVTTCYPFRYVGNAPERFVTYAYPVK
ncbi:class D sortase [Lederbergia lenta]|uniref:Sortase n=1 Tax=Lederbergia lenta TaxID=1467 RepID=A0A2X4WA73_LEDLE|nr:class D sortase [Lederbergia lenta]MCM3111071.1 class D sortase [Lederbergia lenta]MEC2325541.1 class D sortase [Lederbergia lenta]SQI54530.1 sortase [Lederbergia lenta]